MIIDMEKTLGQYTRKELELIPAREWNEDIGEFNSLIILPLRRIHDSGFRCMDFIACDGERPIARLSGCSDVIHIEGISGAGKDWFDKYKQLPNNIPRRDWSIDCLKKSGLLRIFCSSKLTCGPALSSFEIFSVNRK